MTTGYFVKPKSICMNSVAWGPFHKSSYERFLLYEFVEPVLNYGSNEFVALKNLCETGPCSFAIEVDMLGTQFILKC